MAEKSSFFDSINGDRAYYSADWASHMTEYFTNGIFNNGLKVVSNDNMSISIQLGTANINGYKYKLDTNPKVINVTNADGILNRIDNIVIRLDIPNRQITAEIVTGTFAENAVAPELIRGTSIYDIRIAKIYIPAGITAITEDLIEDTRFNNNDCGNVICAVETPNFTDVLTQYEAIWKKLIEDQTADFKTWFQAIKEQFGEDAVGNLLNLINAKADKTYVDTKTLTAANWIKNNTTGYYEYTVTDTTITANHLVQGNMDLANQAKMTDGYIESYAGGYKIITSELPTEDIVMNISIQKVGVVE